MPISRDFVGGGDRSRTGDGGFADLCLTTWLRRPGVGAPHNDERQTTEHIASVLCLTPRRGIGAGEGTRTLDLLHGKQTL